MTDPSGEERRTDIPPQSPRLFVAEDLGSHRRVSLGRDAARYLGAVLRLGPGASVRLFNGRDGEWLSEIAAIEKRAVSLEPLERLRAQKKTAELRLLFAPLKKAAMDVLVEKATELGATGLHPVVTGRTVVRRINRERLAAQAREAAEQCERLDVPHVHELQPLDTLLAGWPEGRPLYWCRERTAGLPLAKALRRQPAGEASAFLIGPEGGFTEEEQAMLSAMPSIIPVSLGPRVLRAETAALVALALWQGLSGGV